MADPRSTSTRRAVLSYSQLKELINWPDLLLKDYQGIFQDYVYTSNELDGIDNRVTELESRVYSVINTTTSLVTGAFETIICRNTIPIDITLNPDAVVNDEVNIKRRGAEVNVIGNIDGLTDWTINTERYSMKLVFDGTEWNEI